MLRETCNMSLFGELREEISFGMTGTEETSRLDRGRAYKRETQGVLLPSGIRRALYGESGPIQYMGVDHRGDDTGMP